MTLCKEFAATGFLLGEQVKKDLKSVIEKQSTVNIINVHSCIKMCSIQILRKSNNNLEIMTPLGKIFMMLMANHCNIDEMDTFWGPLKINKLLKNYKEIIKDFQLFIVLKKWLDTGINPEFSLQSNIMSWARLQTNNMGILCIFCYKIFLFSNEICLYLSSILLDSELEIISKWLNVFSWLLYIELT